VNANLAAKQQLISSSVIFFSSMIRITIEAILLGIRGGKNLLYIFLLKWTHTLFLQNVSSHQVKGYQSLTISFGPKTNAK
jgi:hypothetical protein